MSAGRPFFYASSTSFYEKSIFGNRYIDPYTGLEDTPFISSNLSYAAFALN